ncbi:hypothetical protein OG500_17590 [Kitasatospora sp. NBC_01250]|uniref:hypothetical protein n=1 Tax=Kitasatospora sp. NBC_01250 TaxID=2903571 RepID=UPI002E35117B|nr:hypothetical protein [Kitasatospora sp. NBC_01250]
MDTTTYLLNGLLLVTIVRQVRGTELNLANLLIPLGTVAAAALAFLHSVPTGGGDLTLILGLAGLGAALGALGGSLVRLSALRPRAGARQDAKVRLLARTPLAVLPVLVLGSLARLAFAFAANHGLGQAIADFSRDQRITGQDAWVAALVLMALAEVVTRLTVTRLRGHLLGRTLAAPAAASATVPVPAAAAARPARARAAAPFEPA